ncbi:MAG: hypothetical protein CMF49_09515 [Legionellales bacterium]|nr:hypothetical protein [Legionellales bacterium]|tara:strand:- start:1789 stop:2190 length:402 start_codon:yes stop_codon:yes gene_type:complete
MNSLDTAKDYLSRLDLSYLERKMCSSYYPMPQWQPKLAEVCVMLYKRFLWLLVKYPDVQLVPTRDIDEVWHNHILYTKNYTQDCQALCGRYIHHIPSDPDNTFELTSLSSNFEETKRLYQQEFNEPLKVLQRT